MCLHEMEVFDSDTGDTLDTFEHNEILKSPEDWFFQTNFLG